MANRTKRLDRHQYWQKQLSDWQKSGLSQADFCDKRNLCPRLFSKWKRQLSGSGALARQGTASRLRWPKFVQANLTGSIPTSTYSFEFVKANGEKVKIHADRQTVVEYLDKIVGKFSAPA